MNILFTADAWEDYLYWQQTDKQILKKINHLLREIQRTPFTGIGKPEPLKHQLQGCWSRRIDSEHRLVYEISGTQIKVIGCRLHY
ncbi:MAG: Txe/YoeB family addiction module toxin [Methylococcaceae bacterium]|nr:Txe/YoeB family addiction module toxin [Methylococcaceae bacterium]